MAQHKPSIMDGGRNAPVLVWRPVRNRTIHFSVRRRHVEPSLDHRRQRQLVVEFTSRPRLARQGPWVRLGLAARPGRQVWASLGRPGRKGPPAPHRQRQCQFDI